MNNEHIESKMNFIVEQQAQFASDIQRLEQSQARTDQIVAEMGEVVTRLANVTHSGFNQVNAKINALIDAQIRTEENLALTNVNLARTEENVARTEDNVARTGDNVARTDESLRNLISVVDRYLIEGRKSN